MDGKEKYGNTSQRRVQSVHISHPLRDRPSPTESGPKYDIGIMLDGHLTMVKWRVEAFAGFWEKHAQDILEILIEEDPSAKCTISTSWTLEEACIFTSERVYLDSQELEPVAISFKKEGIDFSHNSLNL
jgi:hypothetical protein